MNALYVGLADKTEQFLQAKPGFLLLDDGPIADAFLDQFPRAKEFNPTVHSFNPLRGMDYRAARDLVGALYSASPEGKDTLTVRNGKRALARLLMDNPGRIDRIQGDPEVEAMLEDLLLSPILRQVLCASDNQFSFKGSIVARLDRSVLTEQDAFVLGTLLIGQFKGQVIVPDFGFYGRDFHTSLIRQNRLVAGLNYLGELPLSLQRAVLTIKDIVPEKCIREDAERLIFYTDTPTGNPSSLM